MIRRSVFRLVLSLVLLLSQQMAMSHALSHWTSQLGGPTAQLAAEDSELSSAFAHDRSCAQCLGLAQLSAPLAGSPHRFVPPELGEVPARDGAGLAWRIRQSRHFDSRAPPVLG
ncbi:MAG: hypothetical protein ACREWI_04490 [Telluria sp.]